jgi:hypothetical protein
MPTFEVTFMALHPTTGESALCVFKDRQTLQFASQEEANDFVARFVAHPVLMTGAAVPEGSAGDTECLVARTLHFPVHKDLVDYPEDDLFAALPPKIKGAIN